MAYRFTNTDKWNDAWFCSLKPTEKLLFLFMIDNCDIAGFLEINTKKWTLEIGIDKKGIDTALKGLDRCYILSKDKDCLYLVNFLKHQKNLPLNQKNSAHIGITKRFALYQYKFDIKDITEFIEGGLKGGQSPLGNGIGTGLGNGLDTDESLKDIPWRKDYTIYLTEARESFRSLFINEEYISEQERFNPDLNIKLTMEKMFVNFWGKEAGWKNKKDSRTRVIDWKATITKGLSYKENRVWLTPEEKKERAANGL